MRTGIAALVGAALIGGVSSAAAVAQRGRGLDLPRFVAADIASDAKNGRMLRVYYSRTADPVAIETTPKVNFACDGGATTECWAYLKPTATVTIQVFRKPADTRTWTTPKGIPARGHQWRESCADASDSCTLGMEAGRSVGVNWIAAP